MSEEQENNLKQEQTEEPKQHDVKAERKEPTGESAEYPDTVFDPESVSKDARTMAVLAHLLGILLGFVGPLIIWLVKKDDDAFIDDQGKEALNFQLNLTVIAMIAGGLSFLCCFLVFILLPLPIIAILFPILGCVDANKGKAYRYPLILRVVK